MTVDDCIWLWVYAEGMFGATYKKSNRSTEISKQQKIWDIISYLYSVKIPCDHRVDSNASKHWMTSESLI